MSAGVSTRAALEARLRPIRDASAGGDRFVADVHALARDLEVRIGCDSLLAVASAGLDPVGAVAAHAWEDPPLSLDEMTGIAEEVSRGSAPWSARRRGLGLALGPNCVDAAERPYVLSGSALRWLVDRGVTIGPQRWGRVDEYVKSVVEMLDRGEDTDPLGAHLNVVVGLADEGIHLPLAEELAAVAWLCDVHDEHVDLEALLRIRDMGLRGMFG